MRARVNPILTKSRNLNTKVTNVIVAADAIQISLLVNLLKMLSPALSSIYNLICVRRMVRTRYSSLSKYWIWTALLMINALASLDAQPFISTDTPPSCYEIDAHVRNGINEFEGALYTPSTPFIGQPGGATWKMNPTGKPVWNTNGNTYGDIHSFLFTYSPANGTTSWNIDFNRDGDYLDFRESVTNVAPTLAGRGFQYINVLVQGHSYGTEVSLTHFTINGIDFGDFSSNSNTPVVSLFENATGLFNEITITGFFSFSDYASSERPRIWIQLGESNMAPTCLLTSPINGTVFNQGTPITLHASASDPFGRIMLVEFYDGDIKIGEDATSPYSFQWINYPSGVRTVRARAIDNHQALAWSAPISISILGDTQPPTSGARILSPMNGVILYDPDTIIITADIIDAIDTTYTMEFFLDNTNLGSDNTAPYINKTLVNQPMGNFTLRAKSTDPYGQISLSSQVNITVRCIIEDINIDGIVSTFDFLLLLSAYGNDCTTSCPADFNGDAEVSTVDFLRLLAKFGYSCL